MPPSDLITRYRINPAFMSEPGLYADGVAIQIEAVAAAG